MTHQYRNNGYNIALDVYSGAVHILDELSYEVLEILEENKKHYSDRELLTPETIDLVMDELGDTGKKEEVAEVLAEFADLRKEGRLFTEDTFEELLPQVKNRKTVIKALCLHVAHDCNLACRYCFADEGEYHGKREIMSLEVGKKALDFLVRSSGNRQNLEVDFFGGEPLMNWDVVKELVKYGRSLEEKNKKKFRFTITTNGVLLDEEVQDFINQEMANVVLSLDGRRAVNDRMRPRRGGQGSYDLIVPKYINLAESRNQEKYYVRGTFTRHNLDFSEDVLHMADLGFKQISVEPVVGEAHEEYAIQEADLPRIMDEYDLLAKKMIEREKMGKGFNFFHFMIDLDGGPCLSKRMAGCGAGTEYLAVTPSGDLYPCHQFVGKDEYLLGNVDVGIVRKDIPDDFRSCSVYSKESCRDCFAKFFCSGGCMANAYNFYHTIHDTYDIGCKMQKKRVECAIMLEAARAVMPEAEK